MKDLPGGFNRRLVAAGLATAAIVAAAALFLPSSLVTMMLLAVFAFPAMLLLAMKPEYVLAIILFMRFTNLDIFLPMRLFTPLSLLLVAALAAAWFDGRKLVLRDRVLAALVLAFLLVAFHSMAFAEELRISAHAFKSFSGVILVITGVLLLVSSRKYFLVFLVVLTVATLISDFMPFLVPPPEVYASKTLMWQEGVLRYEGYQFEANIFAFSQVFIIPILLFLMAKFDRPRFVRPLIMIVLAGTIFVLMLSFSRGGFVGLLMILVGVLIVERKNRKVTVAAALGALILMIVAPAMYWERKRSCEPPGRRGYRKFHPPVRAFSPLHEGCP